MAFDMSQFYQVFFEETAEHLANLETLLLEVDRDNPDSEQLNAIFRAAHSIKGSSGTFGFNDMMEVTHVLETLLDRIRKGEQTLTEEMVDAFLVAGDVLGGLLAAHKGEGEGDAVAMAQIIARLQKLCDGEAAAAPKVLATAAAPVTLVGAAPVFDPAMKTYDIRFVPVAGLAAGTMDTLVGELLSFGTPEVMVRGTREGDPWTLRLTTASDMEAVKDVVDFIAVSGSLSVSPEGAPANDPEGSYGFFQSAGASSNDGAVKEMAYGLFDEASSAAATQAAAASGDAAWGLFEVPAEQQAYGFFEPLGTPVDESWGLFEALLPDAVVLETEALRSPAASVPEGDPAGAYGFFAAPGQAQAAPAAPAAPVIASTPASVSADTDILENDPGGAYGFLNRLSAPSTVAEGSASAKAPLAASPVVAAMAPEPAVAKPREAKPAAPMKAGGDSSIRVSVEKVDQMINLVGELVITQAMLAQSAAALDPVEYERLMNGLVQLERNTRDLQESVMSIRMMPISVVFSRFPRVVRDLSQKLGKQVELKLAGEHTELDKSLIERITDPLTHLVRNSLDHGVEMPEARAAAGKQAMGTITLSASHQSGNIVIEVGDDGAGLSREKILSKARSRGLPVSDSMTDQEVWLLIFEAGFSTAEQVTEVSGRGVGMDVVKRNIGAMGGRVDIQSITGVGTRMTVRLPLTLAILDGMSVAVGGENYIIPLNYVIESLQPTRAMLKTVSGSQRLIKVRGEYLPVVALHEVFNVPDHVAQEEKAIMVVLESDGIKVALLVDALVGQHQVVIKSLEANYRKVCGVSGATIMGDGRVALILDVSALVDMARRAVPAAA